MQIFYYCFAKMYKANIFCFLLLFLYVLPAESASLPTVNDDELVQLIRDSKSLIILFSKFSINFTIVHHAFKTSHSQA